MERRYIVAIIVFIVFVIYSFFNIYYNARNELKSEYSFVVTRIGYDSKGYLLFYKDKEEFSGVYYRLRKNDAVEVGDKVYKKTCSEELFIYRKNIQTDQYELYLKKIYTGILPKSWFCY